MYRDLRTNLLSTTTSRLFDINFLSTSPTFWPFPSLFLRLVSMEQVWKKRRSLLSISSSFSFYIARSDIFCGRGIDLCDKMFLSDLYELSQNIYVWHSLIFRCKIEIRSLLIYRLNLKFSYSIIHMLPDLRDNYKCV